MYYTNTKVVQKPQRNSLQNSFIMQAKVNEDSSDKEILVSGDLLTSLHLTFFPLLLLKESD